MALKELVLNYILLARDKEVNYKMLGGNDVASIILYLVPGALGAAERERINGADEVRARYKRLEEEHPELVGELAELGKKYVQIIEAGSRMITGPVERGLDLDDVLKDLPLLVRWRQLEEDLNALEKKRESVWPQLSAIWVSYGLPEHKVPEKYRSGSHDN